MSSPSSSAGAASTAASSSDAAVVAILAVVVVLGLVLVIVALVFWRKLFPRASNKGDASSTKPTPPHGETRLRIDKKADTSPTDSERSNKSARSYGSAHSNNSARAGAPITV